MTRSCSSLELKYICAAIKCGLLLIETYSDDLQSWYCTYITIHMDIDILTCGDEALLFNSSRTRKVAATSDPTLSIFTVLDSWGEDKNGSDTTTTGLLALSASPICACDNNCR